MKPEVCVHIVPSAENTHRTHPTGSSLGPLSGPVRNWCVVCEAKLDWALVGWGHIGDEATPSSDVTGNDGVSAGLEELVLSEINSPSRTQQTGDSSSVSSFSYRDMMKEAQPTNQNKVGGAEQHEQILLPFCSVLSVLDLTRPVIAVAGQDQVFPSSV